MMINSRYARQEPASLYNAPNQKNLNDLSSVESVFGNFLALFANTKKTSQNDACMRFDSLISKWFVE